MMNIKESETLIQGKWEFKNNKIEKDFNCIRIEELINNHLIKITTDDSGWDTLYQDPNDKRYWELVYLESEMHGGGPPTLRHIKNQLQKYNLDSNVG
jgi:hypothetical protein